MKVYVIPSFNCNLNCPHCDIHKMENEYNDEKFISNLTNIDAAEIILFGGEPLLNKERFFNIVKLNKITSISTNLLLLDDEYIKYIKEYEIKIATSWNPQRFTEKQYALWIDKLKLLKKNNLSCIVLITLTNDLLEYDYTKFLSMLKELDDIGSIDGILFEPLIDYNMDKKLHQKCDEWLCNLYDNWYFNMDNMIINKLKKWNCDCSNVYTLYPNGELKYGCPQNNQQYIVEDCFKCHLANICRPCRLQHICSFPKKLYEKVIKCQNC